MNNIGENRSAYWRPLSLQPALEGAQYYINLAGAILLLLSNHSGVVVALDSY